MAEEEKRRRGRPRKEKPAKVKKLMGRPKIDEPLAGAAKAVYMDTCIKEWLIREGGKLPPNAGRRGGAEYMRHLIDNADWDAPPPQRSWARLDNLPLRLSEAQEQLLTDLARRFQDDVSTIVYERAILPAYLAAYPNLTDSPCPEKKG